MTTLGSILRYRKGKPPAITPGGNLPVLTPGYLRTGHVEELAEQTGREVVLSGGELILLWDGSNAGEFFRARPGILSSTMVVFYFDKKKIKPEYLFYQLKRFEPELKSRTSGSGIPHVDKEILLSWVLVDRDPPEQQIIADVIGTLDKAIDSSNVLLVKHRRVKTGLMYDLLTRGLDASGRLRAPCTHRFKPSRLGPIPEEWDVLSLEDLLPRLPNTLRSGPFGSALLKKDLKSTGIPLLGIDNVHIERFAPVYTRFVDDAMFVKLSRYAVRPLDVMITIMGTVGRCCVVPENIGRALSSKHVWTVTLDPDRYSPYVACWQINYAPWILKQLRQDEQGGVMRSIQSNTLRKLLFPVPPPPEMREIERRLKAVSARLASESTVLSKLISLKNGLMIDLLTGRVPVTPLLQETAAHTAQSIIAGVPNSL